MLHYYRTLFFLFYLMYSRAAYAADGNDPVADLDPDRNGSSDDMDEPHCSSVMPLRKFVNSKYG